MSLSDLASLGSFVSGLAVLASLVFLYFQMRQMTEQVKQAEKNQQASIRQTRATHAVNVVLAATEPSLCEAVGNGMAGVEDIPEVGLLQFYLYWRAGFLEYEDSFFQHSDGFLTDAAFRAFTTNTEAVLRNIGLRALWRMQRDNFSPEFARWIDSLISRQPPIGESLAKVWRQALAAERAVDH